MMKLILVFFLIIITIGVKGQNLEKHQWKNRIILIFSSKGNNEETQNQLQLLQNQKEELAERKLLVYEVYKEYFKYNFNLEKQKSNSLYKQFNKNEKPFKVILIGLDGGIKLSQSTLLSTEKLFTIIDGMPMRKQELRTNKN